MFIFVCKLLQATNVWVFLLLVPVGLDILFTFIGQNEPPPPPHEFHMIIGQHRYNINYSLF